MNATVQLNTEEIRRLCTLLCGLLESDLPSPNSNDDLEVVLQRWREHSAEYVERVRSVAAYYSKPFNAEYSEGTRQANDRAADLLEKLLAHLPAGEVCHA